MQNGFISGMETLPGQKQNSSMDDFLSKNVFVCESRELVVWQVIIEAHYIRECDISLCIDVNVRDISQCLNFRAK